MKQKRRGLKSAGTMSGSSEAGTFVNDIPDYEQGLDFDTCDWLDDVVETEHEIGEGWEGAMQQHRLSASGARGGSSVSYNDIEDTAGFDKTLTYKNVNVFTISQAMALEAQRSNSRASAASRSDRPRSSWSGFSMLDSIYLPKSSHPRGAQTHLTLALRTLTRCRLRGHHSRRTFSAEGRSSIGSGAVRNQISGGFCCETQ